MKTFNVYQHPTQGLEAVKIGFSWPAFFFGIVWMLAKKLWLFAGGFFFAYIFVGGFEAASSEGGAVFPILISLFAYLALWLVPGFMGNKWRESNLKSRGFEFLDAFDGATPDSAIAQATRHPRFKAQGRSTSN